MRCYACASLFICMKLLLRVVSKTYAGMPVRWGLQNHLPWQCVLHTVLLAIECNKSHISRLPQVGLCPELHHFLSTLHPPAQTAGRREASLAHPLLPASWETAGGLEGSNFWAFVCLYEIPLLNLSSFWAYLSLEVAQTATSILNVCNCTVWTKQSSLWYPGTFGMKKVLNI